MDKRPNKSSICQNSSLSDKKAYFKSAIDKIKVCAEVAKQFSCNWNSNDHENFLTTLNQSITAYYQFSEFCNKLNINHFTSRTDNPSEGLVQNITVVSDSGDEILKKLLKQYRLNDPGSAFRKDLRLQLVRNLFPREEQKY